MDSAPEEILIKIFSLLDMESLKNISHVSQRFRSIISNSVDLMDKFELEINPINIEKATEELLHLPYNSININYKYNKMPENFESIFQFSVITGQMLNPYQLDLTDEEREKLISFELKVMKIIKPYKLQFERVKIEFLSTDFMLNILKDMKNLKSLHLKQFYGEEKEEKEFCLEFPNLIHLTSENATDSLKFINCNDKFQSLRFIEYIEKFRFAVDNGRNAKKAAELTEFKKRANIKHLIISGFIPDLKLTSLNLKSLRIKSNTDSDHLCSIPHNEHPLLFKILKMSRNSLKVLELNSLLTDNNEIWSFILNDLKLQTLTAHFYDYKLSENEQISPNQEMKEMKVNLNCDGSINTIKKILSAHPNVEKLCLNLSKQFFPNCLNSEDFNEILKVLAQAMPNLKHLTIDNDKIYEIKENIEISSIETFATNSIHSEDDVKGWTSLVESFPNLRQLELNTFDKISLIPFITSTDSKRVLEFSKKLEEFHVSHGFYLNSELKDVVKNSDTTLKKIVSYVNPKEIGKIFIQDELQVLRCQNGRNTYLQVITMKSSSKHSQDETFDESEMKQIRNMLRNIK